MRDLRELMDDMIWPMVMIIIIWLIFLLNLVYELNLNQWGIQPETLQGFAGIFLAPLLHADVGHIFSNTFPLLVAHSMLVHFYKPESLRIWLIMYFFSGFGVWLYAGGIGVHIGASGLVYALVAFIVASGVIKKNRKLLASGGILIFLYGSMVWGIFPQIDYDLRQRISWEGHLSGALTGIILAWVYRLKGPQNEAFFEDEEEDEDDPGHDEWQIPHDDLIEEDARPLNVRITYVPRKPKD